MSGSLVDNETRNIIIQKTWCHGQAVAPVYGIICLWWYGSNQFQPRILLFPSLYLPYWCFLSYRSIFVEFSYATCLIGGVLAEVAHFFVFIASLEKLQQSLHLFMFIASTLFFIETAVFLGAIISFGQRIPLSTMGAGSRSYQNIDEIEGLV
mgnify:CR=1 FL=1